MPRYCVTRNSGVSSTSTRIGSKKSRIASGKATKNTLKYWSTAPAAKISNFFTKESSKKKCSSNIFSIKAIIVRRGWPSAISAISAQSRATKSTGTNKEKNKRNRILCRPDRVKQQNKPVITEFNVVHSRVKQ